MPKRSNGNGPGWNRFMVPNDVLSPGNGLKPLDRLVLIILLKYDGPNSRGIFPSYAEIARRMGGSITGARNAIARLEKEGWINHGKKGRVNCYTFLKPCLLKTWSRSYGNNANHLNVSPGDNQRDSSEREKGNKQQLAHKLRPIRARASTINPEAIERLNRQLKVRNGNGLNRTIWDDTGAKHDPPQP